MSFSKSRHFIHKVFEAGLLAKAVESFISTLGDKPTNIEIKDYLSFPNGGSAVNRLSAPTVLATICDLMGHNIEVSALTSSREYRSIEIGIDRDLIKVSANSETPDGMQLILTLLTTTLALQEASEEILAKKKGPSIREISDRIAVLEKIVLGPSQTLRCFLSYRFTPDNEDPARKLKYFLTLLGIEVVTGTTYEPRPLSQKVMERLKDDLDFVVLLICHDGESHWTRGEIASAKHKMIPLVPIVEDGANFSPDLFGDLDYVPYAKGHIGDSFFKVLEAVKYVRQQLKPITSAFPKVR